MKARRRTSAREVVWGSAATREMAFEVHHVSALRGAQDWSILSPHQELWGFRFLRREFLSGHRILMVVHDSSAPTIAVRAGGLPAPGGSQAVTRCSLRAGSPCYLDREAHLLQDQRVRVLYAPLQGVALVVAEEAAAWLRQLQQSPGLPLPAQRSAVATNLARLGLLQPSPSCRECHRRVLKAHFVPRTSRSSSPASAISFGAGTATRSEAISRQPCRP